MSHADTQAKRLFTRAANTEEPRLRKQLLVKARKWARRAVETDAQREARVAREMLRHEEQAAKTLARMARKAAAAIRAERWAARQAQRFAHETPEQRAARLADELRRWQEHKAARVALLGKRKKKGSTFNAERWAERAERWRLQEAIAQAKREAKRKQAAPTRVCPPLPY